MIVVYNPRTNEALIRLAREAARAHGLELVALEALTAEESTILPLVLKESWCRNLPVFSSSVLHVKQGAMFGLYPNHLQLGRDLAALALLTTVSVPTFGHGLSRSFD